MATLIDWTPRHVQILNRLLEMAHTPGSGFIGVWVDDMVIRLKLQQGDDPDQFRRVSWEQAAEIGGLVKIEPQSVMITANPKVKSDVTQLLQRRA